MHHYAILQRWPGDKAETLAMEYPPDKEDECKNMFYAMRKSAFKLKHPVEYRMVELPGEIQYPGKEEDDRRKALGVKQIIIAQGLIHDIIPYEVQKDIKE